MINFEVVTQELQHPFSQTDLNLVGGIPVHEIAVLGVETAGVAADPVHRESRRNRNRYTHAAHVRVHIFHTTLLSDLSVQVHRGIRGSTQRSSGSGWGRGRG